MYYGYNQKKELVLADEAFINILGCSSFNEAVQNSVVQTIQYENNKLTVSLSNKIIEANYTETDLYSTSGPIKLVKLSNMIERSGTINNLQLNYHPIYLDVQKISKSIGLSVDDYKLYLDSFIDQSIIDEKRLQEGDETAIKNLSNLALTLQIPNIGILLLKIKKLPREERLPFVDEYYTKLALLTLKKPANMIDDEMNMLEEDSHSEEHKEELLNSRFTELLHTIESKEKSHIDNTITLQKSTPPPSESGGVKKVSLDNVTPLPISYNPKVAADELNLPVVLIEEFVEDFIEQAHHDKDHLLASYYQKDMDNIHELGHKLKGAASNLRINELADVLEEIQFCTDHSKLEGLFTKYWGLFLSLEDYMKQSAA
ncbi:MAG: Hpt domain-containing protein [Campylobacterales bacterium]|nr:Hpt domain-containing protein [Campylobacterales bacterium]